MKHTEFQQHPSAMAPPSHVYPPYPSMTVPMPMHISGVYPSAPPSYDEAVAAERSEFVIPPPPPPMVSSVFISSQPPPSYIPPSQQQTQPTIFTMQFGLCRANVRCPACNADVLTRTESGPSCIAHLCCLLLALMQCYLCSCLPYCMDSLQTVRHYCPNCNTYLGRYEP